MTRRLFLDSSVLIDAMHAGQTDHHARAVALLSDVAARSVEIQLSATVLFETAYVLVKRYGAPRPAVAQAFRDLLRLPAVYCLEQGELLLTIELWTREAPLSFADCYHLVLAESLGLDAIYASTARWAAIPGSSGWNRSYTVPACADNASRMYIQISIHPITWTTTSERDSTWY